MPARRQVGCGSLRRIRQVDDKHHLTLLCRDLSELARFARVDNQQYRLLKLGTPGPFTFILEATKEVPRRLSHPSRRTIGLRVPDHKVTQELLSLFGEPLLATTLIPPGASEPLNDADEIRDQLGKTAAGDRRRRRLPDAADDGDRPQRRRPGAGSTGPRRPGTAGAVAPTSAQPRGCSARCSRSGSKPTCGVPRTTITGVPGDRVASNSARQAVSRSIRHSL